jgi:hypothetical protein
VFQKLASGSRARRTVVRNRSVQGAPSDSEAARNAAVASAAGFNTSLLRRVDPRKVDADAPLKYAASLTIVCESNCFRGCLKDAAGGWSRRRRPRPTQCGCSRLFLTILSRHLRRALSRRNPFSNTFYCIILLAVWHLEKGIYVLRLIHKGCTIGLQCATK